MDDCNAMAMAVMIAMMPAMMALMIAMAGMLDDAHDDDAAMMPVMMPLFGSDCIQHNEGNGPGQVERCLQYSACSRSMDLAQTRKDFRCLQI